MDTAASFSLFALNRGQSETVPLVQESLEVTNPQALAHNKHFEIAHCKSHGFDVFSRQAETPSDRL